MRKLRLFALALTGLMPGFLKKPIYRWCFGYRIGRKVKIGIVILDCKRLTIDDHARISHATAFVRCGDVHIGKHAIVGPLNLFRGGDKIRLGDYSLVLRMNVVNAIPDNDCVNDADSSFYLGYGSVVTAEHRIDFTDRVRIGRHTTFGGRNSSIWTHNRRRGLPVEIGDYCYVGSEIRMAPGSRIPDCSIVGMGSVITRPFYESYSMIAGVPAERRRAITSEDQELLFVKTRPDLPDEAYPALPAESFQAAGK